jgi:tetratricopeptide (TPR) repeat protein
MTLLALLFCGGPAQAQTDYRQPGSQKAAVCGGGCGGSCGPCGGQSSGGNAGQSSAQNAQNQREAAANALNEQGIAANHNEDYEAAAAAFEKAIELTPDNSVFRLNLAAAQNGAAVQAYNKGDYATALNYLQQAQTNMHKLGPIPSGSPKYRKHEAEMRLHGNTKIDENLVLVQEKLAEAQREQEQQEAEERALAEQKQKELEEERRAAQERALADQKAAEERIALSRQNKIAADHIQQGADDFAQSLRAAPSSNELDFSAGRPNDTSVKSSGLTFTASDPIADGTHALPSTGGSTGFFGAPSNPPDPDLDHSAPAPTNAVHSALDQLVSAVNSGAAANAKGISDEAAKVESNCALDARACAKSVPIPVRWTPAAAEVASHIKDDRAKKDSVVQQSMAYYQKLDGLRIDAQAKLTAVQRQINSGAGDNEVLMAKKLTLINDVKRYDADQANTLGQIKERLVKIGVPWNESPPPATGGAAKQ